MAFRLSHGLRFRFPRHPNVDPLLLPFHEQGLGSFDVLYLAFLPVPFLRRNHWAAQSSSRQSLIAQSAREGSSSGRLPHRMRPRSVHPAAKCHSGLISTRQGAAVTSRLAESSATFWAANYISLACQQLRVVQVVEAIHDRQVTVVIVRIEPLVHFETVGVPGPKYMYSTTRVLLWVALRVSIVGQ
jgi:hypothetical protein